MTPAEVRAILDELARRLDVDVERLWRASADLPSDEFRRLIIEAFPEVVLPLTVTAATVGAEYYASQPSAVRYAPAPVEPMPVERLSQSATWALNVGSSATAVDLLKGSAARALFDGFRETVRANVDSEPGARWARHASANACGFCRMVATRHVGPNATFYSSEQAAGRVVGRGQEMSAADRRDRAAGRVRSSETRRLGQFISGGRRARGTQALGDRYHDNCKCLAVAVRPGQDWEPPPYVLQWDEDYIAATQLAAKEGLTRGRYGAMDPKVIARLMEQV